MWIKVDQEDHGTRELGGRPGGQWFCFYLLLMQVINCAEDQKAWPVYVTIGNILFPDVKQPNKDDNPTTCLGACASKTQS